MIDTIDWDKVFRIPSAAELKQTEIKRYAQMGDIIRDHRGYTITKNTPTHYEVWMGSIRQTACGSAWSCICWIDERLAP